MEDQGDNDNNEPHESHDTKGDQFMFEQFLKSGDYLYDNRAPNSLNPEEDQDEFDLIFKKANEEPQKRFRSE